MLVDRKILLMITGGDVLLGLGKVLDFEAGRALAVNSDNDASQPLVTLGDWTCFEVDTSLLVLLVL